MIIIDGSEGEGGGQILRTSLSLSMITGEPVHFKNVRAGRKKPGLMRQHLTCVRAAAEISGADVVGAELGTMELTFRPNRVKPGDYHFAIGTAGATTLVAQTVLPALMMGDKPSKITLEGGTHNMQCPSLEFLTEAFLPQIAKMGVDTDVLLERRGFHPVGGGRWILEVNPARELTAIELLKRGPRRSLDAEILMSQLGTSIAKREAKVIARALEMDDRAINIVEDTHALGPGNALQVFARFDQVTEIFTGLGKLGVQAETIAKRLGKATNRYLNSKAAVGHYLADQLLLPMALAGGGRFTTMRPSLHTMTNIATIQKFLDVEIDVSEDDEGIWTVVVNR